MKIYYINRVLISLLLFTDIASSNTSSNLDNIYLKTEVGIGVLQGTVGEYVYSNNRKLSQLNWNINSLWYTNVLLALQYQQFYAGVQVQNGFTARVGTIDDSDWADQNNPGVKTHYSEHDNYLERYCSYNANIGFESAITDNTYLKPHIGLLYRSIKMSARDGYLEYPPGSPKVPVYGVGIIYEQLYYIPYVALSSEINITEKLGIIAGLSFSLFAYAQDIDNHVKRNPGDDIDFYGEYDGIVYLSVYTGCQYFLNDDIAVSLNLLYEYVPEQKGDTYYINTTTGIKSSTFHNAAGLKYEIYSAKLSFLYNVKLL